MKQIKYFIFVLILSSLLVKSLYAQSTIATSGNNATGNGGSVSYTIGQSLCNTISGINGTIVQGVQQPHEISVVTAIESSDEISLQCTVYPNPTMGIIKLVIESLDHENIRFQIYNLNGVILLDKKVVKRETEISVLNFSSTIYFLKIISNNKELKVFKIVKR